MICLPCRTVGRAITIQKLGGSTFNTEGARALHARCRHPSTCTCQHKVTMNALREEAPRAS